jgi:hypothetical protein
MRRFSSAASGDAIIVVVVVLAFLVGPSGGLIVNSDCSCPVLKNTEGVLIGYKNFLLYLILQPLTNNRC